MELKEALESKVVVSWSGGLDTTGLIFLLLENYDCEVFPLFVNRGQTNLESERTSIKFHEKFFLEKYNSKFHESVEVEVNIPPSKFRDFGDKAKYALRNSDIINQGVRYALQYNIRAVLLGTFENEDIYGDGKNEYFFAKTKEVNVGTKEDFLICSAFQQQGFPQTKKDVIKECHTKNFELDKTHSCYSGSAKHCGLDDCRACQSRMDAFKDAGITDKTEYMKKK